MGRLFWKFFFFIWLGQLTTVLLVTTYFWWANKEVKIGSEYFHVADTHPHPHRMPPPIEPLVGGFVASVLFAALLARHFSRPIRILRSAFDAAAAGKLDVRVGNAMGGSKDELKELGQDFDRMAAQLEALVKGQRRLLHDVSHELRSPLARLQAAIGIARQQPAKWEVSMDRIEKESMRMDRLVGEVLTLSRLEAGMAGGRIEDIDVEELLSGLVDDARFEAEARGIRVTLAGDSAGVVRGDGELLHRAIENVLRNALKHSPSGTTVAVAIQPEADPARLRILVEDSGPGVPENELEDIFRPFYRSEGAKDGDGHGLGLAISRQAVESMGGWIKAGSRPEGGLTMELNLPVQMLPRDSVT